MAEGVQRFCADEVYKVTDNSRIVALRWDIVPYGMVWDLDVYMPPEASNLMGRAWILFDHVSEISLPVVEARIPTGIWVCGGPASRQLSETSVELVFECLLPFMDRHDKVMPMPCKSVRVVCQEAWGAVSLVGAEKSVYGLDWNVRRELASDEALRSCLLRCAESG